MSVTVQRSVESPLGTLRLLATDLALVAVYFPEHRHVPTFNRAPHAETSESHPVLDLAARELDEFFLGKRRTFTTPTAPRGTNFQKMVWSALLEIPFGESCTYGEMARRIGRPHSARAVGAANAMNPLSIFVPCHRVMGQGGSLVGYAGGLDRKRWLLEHEGVFTQ